MGTQSSSNYLFRIPLVWTDPVICMSFSEGHCTSIGMHVCLVDRNLYAIRGKKVDTGIFPRNGISDGV